jgi:hypothetical protein
MNEKSRTNVFGFFPLGNRVIMGIDDKSLVTQSAAALRRGD